MDKFEKFLRSEMSARRLCELVEGGGLGQVLILQNLQNAHDNIIAKRVQERSKAIASRYPTSTMIKVPRTLIACVPVVSLWLARRWSDAKSKCRWNRDNHCLPHQAVRWSCLRPSHQGSSSRWWGSLPTTASARGLHGAAGAGGI